MNKIYRWGTDVTPENEAAIFAMMSKFVPWLILQLGLHTQVSSEVYLKHKDEEHTRDSIFIDLHVPPKKE